MFYWRGISYKLFGALFFVLLPILFIWVIGLPVRSDTEYKELQRESLVPVTKRCYAVQYFDQFTNCLIHNQRLSGFDFYYTVSKKITTMHGVFGSMFVISIVGMILSTGVGFYQYEKKRT